MVASVAVAAKMVEIGLNSDSIAANAATHTTTIATATAVSQTEAARDSRKSSKLARMVGKSEEANSGVDTALVRAAREALEKLAKEELDNGEGRFCRSHLDDLLDASNPAILWRYLEHCERDVQKTMELVKTALIWHKENNIAHLNEADFPKDFWLQAPLGFTGRSRAGDDLLYVVGRHYRKPDAILKDHIRAFMTNLLFGWDRRHKNDLSKFHMVFDVSDSGYANMDLDFIAWLVSVRDYLPQRIAAIYIVGIPFILRPVIKLIISWLPEKFKRITQCGTFDQLVRENIDDDSLPVEVGGSADDSYRLAPIETKWATDIDEFNTDKMRKALRDCIGFHISDERNEQLRQMQLDHENNLRNR